MKFKLCCFIDCPKYVIMSTEKSIFEILVGLYFNLVYWIIIITLVLQNSSVISKTRKMF